jgi:ribosomal protein S18 acetylase RimI-like enzyme
VADAGDPLAGFIVLVTDERRWRADLARRGGRRGRLFATAACRPRTVLAHLSNAWRKRPRRAASSAPPPTCGAPPADRTWIELIAVDPSCRGLGLARRLLNHAEQRTKHLRRDAIQLSVGTANRSAIRCYAAAGFGTVHQAGDDLVLGKRLVPAA